MREVGVNQVPVEGINGMFVNEETYCDDRVVVRYDQDQVSRLCVMIRILTALLTMELVVLGYVCALYDMLQGLVSTGLQNEVSERERVVCGAASEGGNYAARTSSSTDGNVNSLNDDEERSGGEGVTLESTSEEGDAGQEIHDNGISGLFDTEPNDGQSY